MAARNLHKFPLGSLGRGGVERLIDCCSDRCPTGLRNRALIAVLWWTSLPLSKVLALVVEDLDPGDKVIRVGPQKTAERQVIIMGPQPWALLDQWLARREKLDPPAGATVFCTLRGGPMSPDHCRKLFSRLASKVLAAGRNRGEGGRS